MSLICCIFAAFNGEVLDMDDKSRSKKQNSQKITNFVKKALMSGVGAVFMTEESIRNILLEMKLPKSVILSAISQADKTKKEVMQLIANEVRQFLDNIEADKLIKKIISGSIIEVSASIKFVDKETKLNAKKKIKS